MKITDQQLLNLISQGESETLEFKVRLRNQHDAARVLTAFANTEGGYLIIGVSNNREILGLSYQDSIATADRLTKICNSLFSFPFEVGIVNVDGKNLVYANISKAPKHLAPITTATGESNIRKDFTSIKESTQPHPSYIDLKVSPYKDIIGFVAMSFRDEEEPALIDYFNAMLRSAKKTKLPIKLNCIDLKEGDYEISQQLMLEIENSDFVLADFTLKPHNVYFKVGFARGARKPIIQTARKDTTLQFDVRNWTTLFFRNATELEEKLVAKFQAVYDEIIKRQT